MRCAAAPRRCNLFHFFPVSKPSTMSGFTKILYLLRSCVLIYSIFFLRVSKVVGFNAVGPPITSDFRMQASQDAEPRPVEYSHLPWSH